MWFSLRSPELAEDFERLMADDRDIVRGSLDTVSEWRLTRPLDVPGQSIEAADYVLICGNRRNRALAGTGERAGPTPGGRPGASGLESGDARRGARPLIAKASKGR